jgi:hypothetical protein
MNNKLLHVAVALALCTGLALGTYIIDTFEHQDQWHATGTRKRKGVKK